MFMKLVVPQQMIRSWLFPECEEVHYIGGTDVLPPPLEAQEENDAICACVLKMV